MSFKKIKKRISISIKNPEGKDLVLIMPGLSGRKEGALVQRISDTLNKKNYTIISFDPTSRTGKSGSRYKNATITENYNILKDVIKYSKTQKWYKPNMILIGHSTGGFCIIKYAIENPNEVKTIIPIAPLISGEMSLRVIPKIVEKIWKKAGALPLGPRGRLLNWSFVEDLKKQNILEEISNLSVPVLLIAAGKDTQSPLSHQEILYEKIPSPKKIKIIKNAQHTLKKENHLVQIQFSIEKWLEKLIEKNRPPKPTN